MKFRQLEHLLALAEYRNFHRAADAIGLTQPALSQSIRKLEEEYGVALFERSRRDVSPTAFGLVVIQSARQVLGQVAHLRREVDLMKNLQSGRLIVGCDAWIAEGLLGPALARMLADFPNLRFTIRVGTVEEMHEDLLAGRVDLYIGPPPEARDPRIAWQDIELPSMVMVCKPGHPLLRIEKPTALDCLAYPLAAPVLPKWYLEWLGRQIGEPSTPEGRDVYSYFVESDDTGTIRHLVRTTEMITGMLPSMVADEVERGLLCTFHLEEMAFSTPAVIASASARPMAPAGEVLMREVLSEARSMCTIWGRPAGRDAADRDATDKGA